MESWRKLAAEKLAAADAPSLPATPSDPIDALTSKVEAMARARSPRHVSDVTAWAAVVRDAVRLIREGWAAKALSLGWTEMDLFGVGRRDSWDYSGLAIWLDGREILAITEDYAVARTTSGRAYFNRQGWGHGKDADSAPIPLWEYGQ